MLGKIEGRQEMKGTTKDEVVGWHHSLNGHEFEQTQGDSERQESLTCYTSFDHFFLETAEVGRGLL